MSIMIKFKKILFIFLLFVCCFFSLTIILGNVFYYFKFKEFSTITFNSNGGTEIEAQTFQTGSIVELPTKIEKLGFEFIGWQLDNVIVESPITINKNIKLVAKWKAIKVNTYAVKFYNEDGTLYSRQLVKENSLAYSPKIPFKAGYTFEYWSYNGEKFDFNTKINSNFELFAIFKEKINENEYDSIVDEGYNQEILED